MAKANRNKTNAIGRRVIPNAYAGIDTKGNYGNKYSASSFILEYRSI